MSIVLDEIGEHEQAAKLPRLRRVQKEILAAMDKAIVREVDPPFVRIALDGEEPISNPITSTRLGSYWNLVVPVRALVRNFPHRFPTGRCDHPLHPAQRRALHGADRVASARAGGWKNVQNIDDLYVIRYALSLLKRDEPDRRS